MNCNVCKWCLAFSRGVPKEKGKICQCNGYGLRAKKCHVKRGCLKLRKNQIQYCYECSDMSCKNLNRIECLYNEQYSTSLVGNLQELKQKGLARFLQTQKDVSGATTAVILFRFTTGSATPAAKWVLPKFLVENP
jgi:hypothetical protein